jgi:ATP adenylyltransferase
MAYLNGEEPTPQGCLFCKSAQKEDAEVHIVHRARSCYVMLNRYPYNNGHLMVVPYAHVRNLDVLEEEKANELIAITQLSLRVLRAAYQPEGFNLGMNIGQAAGAGVAKHLHMHVVPRWLGDNNYLSVVGGTRTIPEWMDETYARLRPLFEELQAPQVTSK